MSDEAIHRDRARHRSVVAQPVTDNERLPVADTATVTEFTVFYRESAPRLVAFLRWQGASLPDAADSAQEALTLAFQQWSTLRHPYAWCRLVASRLYTRRVATVHEQPVDDLDAVAGFPLIASGADLDAIEQRYVVVRLLDLLPARQRQVMAWTYDGATPTEIAESLRISPDAVRSNLYKARTALRGHLNGLEYDR